MVSARAPLGPRNANSSSRARCAGSNPATAVLETVAFADVALKFDHKVFSLEIDSRRSRIRQNSGCFEDPNSGEFSATQRSVFPHQGQRLIPAGRFLPAALCRRSARTQVRPLTRVALSSYTQMPRSPWLGKSTRHGVRDSSVRMIPTTRHLSDGFDPRRPPKYPRDRPLLRRSTAGLVTSGSMLCDFPVLAGIKR